MDNFNGTDDKDFSLRAMGVMSVVEGKGIHGTVQGIEEEREKKILLQMLCMQKKNL